MKKIFLTIVVIIVGVLAIKFHPLILTESGTPVVADTHTNGLIFPKAGPYFLVHVQVAMPSDFSWQVFAQDNYDGEPLSGAYDNTGPTFFGNTNIFSPSGMKILYPTDEQSAEIANEFGGQYLDQSYGLAIHDATTNRSKTLVLEDRYRLRPVEYPALFGWTSENQIAYPCGKDAARNTFQVPAEQYCLMNIDTGQVSITPTKPAIQETALPSAEPKNNVCVYNPDRSVCITLKPRFYSYESYLLYELWLKKNGDETMIYRGSERPDKLYWAADGNVYVSLYSKNIQKLEIK